ncbi:unnamed protein product [Amoebophrya sp. A25]|nr:unnamed protein product [Amoebophrya sp. A25]|eukprot:GSA25T00025325001.1
MQRVSAGGEFRPGDTNLESDYLGLSLYDELPTGKVSIPQFEDMAKQRLKVLHIIDRLATPNRPVGKELDENAQRKCKAELDAADLWLKMPKFDDEVAEFAQKREVYRYRDLLSHHILRLVFCRNREARQWFCTQEGRLFALRIQELSDPAKYAFYRDTGNAYPRYTGKNLRELQEATPDARIFGAIPVRYEEEFFEIPFLAIQPYWISKRRVVLKKGKAFVPRSLMLTHVVDIFKRRLSSGLASAFAGLDHVSQDRRIAPFIRTLQENGQNLYIAREPSVAQGPSEKLSLANFEIMMKRSFPPCMRWTVQYQRDSKKRLKHQGKLQLRPFLREAGFDLKSSLSWWRQEVSRDPEMDEGKFEKNFVYDIEHAYGKKGHLKGQNAFGCASIIGFPLPSGGQVHGCPFKVMDSGMLKTVLQHWQVPSGDIEDITTKSSGKHYQLACKEFFCKTHPGSSGEGVGNLPQQFFVESVNYYNNASGGGKAAGGPAPMEVT